MPNMHHYPECAGSEDKTGFSTKALARVAALKKGLGFLVSINTAGTLVPKDDGKLLEGRRRPAHVLALQRT